MNLKVISLRPFIGAQDFELSRSFYRDFGFTETVIDSSMSVFAKDALSFYLQNAYVKDWVDNTMLFMEVEDVNEYWNWLLTLKLTEKYSGVRLTAIRHLPWGSECFVHDPAGILWHIGEFKK